MATMSFNVVCFLIKASLVIGIFNSYSEGYNIVDEVSPEKPTYFILTNSIEKSSVKLQPENQSISPRNAPEDVFQQSQNVTGNTSSVSILTNISAISSSNRLRRRATFSPNRRLRRPSVTTGSDGKPSRPLTNSRRRILADGHFQRSGNIRQRVPVFPANHGILVQGRFRPFPESSSRPNRMRSNPVQRRSWSRHIPNPEPEVSGSLRRINPGSGFRGMKPNPEPGMVRPNPEPSRIVPNPEASRTIPNPEPGMIRPNPEPGRTVPNPEPGRTIPNPEPGMVRPNPEPGRIVPNPEPSRNIPNPEPGMIRPNPEPGRIVPNPEPSRNIPNPEPGMIRPNPEPSRIVPNPEPSRTMPNPEPGIVRPNPEHDRNGPNLEWGKTGPIGQNFNLGQGPERISPGAPRPPILKPDNRFSGDPQFTLKRNVQIQFPQISWSAPVPWPRQQPRQGPRQTWYPFFQWWQKRVSTPSDTPDPQPKFDHTEKQPDTKDAGDGTRTNRGDVDVPDQCVALTRKGDCNFYRCFDQRHTCPVEQNFAYNVASYLCRRTEEFLNFFDDKAKTYLRGVKRCQMEALVPTYESEVTTCSQIEAVGLDILTGGILPRNVNDVSCFFQNSTFCDVMVDPQNVQLLYDLYGGHGYTEYRVFIHFVKLIQKCSSAALESFNERYAQRFMTFEE